MASYQPLDPAVPEASWTFHVQEAINSLFCSSWLELVFYHLRFKES